VLKPSMLLMCDATGVCIVVRSIAPVERVVKSLKHDERKWHTPKNRGRHDTHVVMNVDCAIIR